MVCTCLSWYNAHIYSLDILAALDEERVNPNESTRKARKAGKVSVTHAPSNVSNRTARFDADIYQPPVMATNGFVANRPQGVVAWEP